MSHEIKKGVFFFLIGIVYGTFATITSGVNYQIFGIPIPLFLIGILLSGFILATFSIFQPKVHWSIEVIPLIVGMAFAFYISRIRISSSEFSSGVRLWDYVINQLW